MTRKPRSTEFDSPKSEGPSRLGSPRPTTNKILESLMGILAPRLEDAKVMDLFAGTGRVGLACLDHEAASVLFVEGHTRLARALAQKTTLANRKSQCCCMLGTLPEALEKITVQFDLVLCDPPYGDPSGLATLKIIADQPDRWMAPDGWLVFEHHHKDGYPEEIGKLTRHRSRRFGESQLSFYSRPELEAKELPDAT